VAARASGYRLRSPSVGATFNLILASVLGQQETILENISCEPEVVDFIDLLNAAGARIRWFGDRVISITPAKRLEAVERPVIPDRIAVMTYLVAAVLLERGLLVTGVRAEHMQRPLGLLGEIGAPLEVDAARGEIRLRARGLGKLRPFDIAAEPYPGFPTDLQPIFAALAARIDGRSSIVEGVFDGRFQYVPELRTLGSNIEIRQGLACVDGERRGRLDHARYACTDIRGGMSCTLYAMSHHAEIVVERFSEIERGYVEAAQTFRAFGYDLLAP
jgi:UDP-N-acetylglucosamine 1-carboxyvinyltransferase